MDSCVLNNFLKIGYLRYLSNFFVYMCSERSRSSEKNLRAKCSRLLWPSLHYTDFEIDMEKSKLTASGFLTPTFLALIPMEKKVKMSTLIGDQL